MTSDKNKVIALTAVAFALRAVGIGFGPYHPDEHLVINHALAFGTGDLNPHMFYFPSFFMYLVFFVYGLFYAAGHGLGYFRNADDLLTLFLTSPQIFYGLGRVVSVCFGTASVWAIYAFGKEYRNARTGILAAFFLTVNFLHVRDSHFAVMDIALTFFCILSFYFLFRFWNSGKQKQFAWAVITAGMASAVKYNAFVLALPIGMVYFFERADRGQQLSGMKGLTLILTDAFRWGCCMAFTFFAFSPYCLLDFQTARAFVTQLYGINRGFGVHWLNHARMLFYSLDAPLFLLAAAGALIALLGRHKKEWVLIVFFSVYYVMITKAGQPFERYVLILLPVCFLWAGSFLDHAADRMARRWARTGKMTVVLILLLGAMLLPKTVYSDALFLRTDTRQLAYQWIQKHVAPGAVVVIDDPGQCPKLMPTKEQIADKISRLNGKDALTALKRKRLERLLSLERLPTRRYNLHFLGQKDVQAASYQMLGPFVNCDPAEVVAVLGREGYLVTSDKSMGSHETFYAALNQNADLELVASFDPRRDKTLAMNAADWTYMPIDGFFWNAERPGPWISIFKVKR